MFRQFEVNADVAFYVDLFFQETTRVEPYPETLPVLHLAAWRSAFPVEFILISRSGGSLQATSADVPARARTPLEPHEVLHVGDNDVDDVKGAKTVGLHVAWINRDGRRRRPDVPPPDFEIADLIPLPPLLHR